MGHVCAEAPRDPRAHRLLRWARGLSPVLYSALSLPAVRSRRNKAMWSSVRCLFLHLRRAGNAGPRSPPHVVCPRRFLSGWAGKRGVTRFLLAAAGFHRHSYWLPWVSRRVAPEVACGRRPLGGGDFERRRARHGGGGGGPAAGPAPPGERGAAATLSLTPSPFFPTPSSHSRRLSLRCWAGGWRPPSPGPCCCCPSAPRPSSSSAAFSPCARCAGSLVRALPGLRLPALALRLPQRQVFLERLFSYCGLLRADCFFLSFRFFRWLIYFTCHLLYPSDVRGGTGDQRLQRWVLCRWVACTAELAVVPLINRMGVWEICVHLLQIAF